MIEVRFHGRGGQGVVLASTILAHGAFLAGNYSQSFPVFGGERRGAPIKAFARIGKAKEAIRCQIYEPDYAVVFDSSLVGGEIFAGVKAQGCVLINHAGGELQTTLPEGVQFALFDANKVAVNYELVANGLPVVNTITLGAFLGVARLFELEYLLEAIRQQVPGSRAEANVAAAADAYAMMLQRWGDIGCSAGS
ncbi:MAG: 2-oxoacid:acceptor oxidoreductase family protein [Bacillota bacterium]